jgi:hypothetical protein
MPTHLITLSPAFLEALRKVAPKVRPRRLPYVLTLAAVVSIGVASGQRILANHSAAAVVASAPPAPSAAAAPERVDSVVTTPGKLRPDVAVTNASGNAMAGRPTAPPTAISVDELPHATIPKSTKNRHLQAPR